MLHHATLSELAVHEVSPRASRRQRARAASTRMVMFGGLWAVGGLSLGAASVAVAAGPVVTAFAALAVLVGAIDIARGAVALRA